MEELSVGDFFKTGESLEKIILLTGSGNTGKSTLNDAIIDELKRRNIRIQPYINELKDKDGRTIQPAATVISLEKDKKDILVINPTGQKNYTIHSLLVLQDHVPALVEFTFEDLPRDIRILYLVDASRAQTVADGLFYLQIFLGAILGTYFARAIKIAPYMNTPDGVIGLNKFPPKNISVTIYPILTFIDVAKEPYKNATMNMLLNFMTKNFLNPQTKEKNLLTMLGVGAVVGYLRANNSSLWEHIPKDLADKLWKTYLGQRVEKVPLQLLQNIFSKIYSYFSEKGIFQQIFNIYQPQINLKVNNIIEICPRALIYPEEYNKDYVRIQQETLERIIDELELLPK